MKKLFLFSFFTFLIAEIFSQSIAPQNLFVLTPQERTLFTPSSVYLPVSNNWTGYEGPSLEGFWDAFNGDTLPIPLGANQNPGGWFSPTGTGSQNHAMLWMGESSLAYALQGNAAQYEIAAQHCICLLDSLDFVQGHMRFESFGLYIGFWEGGAAAMALAGLYAPAGSTSGPHLLASARKWWMDHVALLRTVRTTDGQVMRIGARMNHNGPGDDDIENLSPAVNLQLIDPQPYNTLHPSIAARITVDGQPQNLSSGYNPVTWNEPRAVAERWMVLRAFQAGAILRAPANESTPLVAQNVYKWTQGNKTFVATPSVTGYHNCRWEVSWQAGQYVYIEVSDSVNNPHGGGDVPWTPPAPQYVNIPSTAKHILGSVFTTPHPSCASTNSCGNDVAVMSIVKPFVYGCEKNINPQVVIKNNGTTNITNLSLYYEIDNFSLYSQFGKGATKCKHYSVTSGPGLKPDSLITLTLDASSVAVGQHTIKVWVMDVNKITDVNATNDLQTLTFNVVNSGLPMNFTEDFENATTGQIPNNWSIYNPDSNGNWFVYATATNKAAAFNNYAYTGAQNEKDELIMPDVNLTGNNSAYLTFDLCHASRPAPTKYDSLEVLISTDCGNTFTSIWGKGGTSLNTVADDANLFIPTIMADYKNVQINLSTYTTSSNAIIKFVNWSNNGNSTLIDNINITPSSSTGISENNFSGALNIFPNPTKDFLTIQFQLKESEEIKLQLINVLG